AWAKHDTIQAAQSSTNKQVVPFELTSKSNQASHHVCATPRRGPNVAQPNPTMHQAQAWAKRGSSHKSDAASNTHKPRLGHA
ncbi:hypothetical protein PIB30_094503, partial [Stylosanthes scabra]|nr:hypothetical protein [Stylosanthes scabra]